MTFPVSDQWIVCLAVFLSLALITWGMSSRAFVQWFSSFGVNQNHLEDQVPWGRVQRGPLQFYQVVQMILKPTTTEEPRLLCSLNLPGVGPLQEARRIQCIRLNKTKRLAARGRSVLAPWEHRLESPAEC